MTIQWGKKPAPQLVAHTGKSKRGKTRVNCGKCTHEEGFCWHQCRKKYAGSLSQRSIARQMFMPLDPVDDK